MRRRTLLAGLVAVAGLLAPRCASAKDYTVKKGDTLSAIAREFSVKLADLEAANPQFSSDYDLIHVGDIVHIPGSSPTSATKKESAASYKTEVGDGPVIEVFEPARGAQLPIGPTHVKAKATHKSGVAVVVVGTKVLKPADDGTFEAVVTLKEGANVILIKAVSGHAETTDVAIGVVAGKFLEPGKLVPSAAAARISNEALKVAAPIAGKALETNILGLSGKKLHEWDVGPIPIIHTTIKTIASVGDVKVGSADVTLEGTPAGLYGDISITGLDVGIVIDVDAGSFFGHHFGLKHTLPVHFDKFSAHGLVDARVSDGTLVVDAGGLGVDYSPTLIEDVIGKDKLAFLETALSDLSKIIPGHPKLAIDEVALVNKLIDLAWEHGLKKTADEKLASVIVSTGEKGLPVKVGKVAATIKYMAREVKFDSTGFSLVSDLEVVLPVVDVHASKGSLVVGGEALELTGSTGIKLAIAQDTINRILEEGWRKGELDKTIDIDLAKKLHMLIGAKDLGLLVPVLDALVPEGSELEFALKPGAAPVIELTKDGNGKLELTEMHLELGINTPKGKHVTIFVLDVHSTIPVSFSVTSGDKPALVLKLKTPKFTFDLLECIIKDVPKVGVESVLGFVVPPVVTFTAKSLLGPIPLPSTSVAGVTPTVEKLTTDGPKKDFLRADLGVK